MIVNDYGLSYTGKLLLGTQLAEANVVYDTGSGYLTVSAANCTSCDFEVYDPAASNTSVRTSTDTF
jgi:hypothetical protein